MNVLGAMVHPMRLTFVSFQEFPVMKAEVKSISLLKKLNNK